ncbi:MULTISPECIES: hypothetical protein [unclassified Rhodococcus (in: high G+C Gram-positive bacteria)]|jgi:hypothetical protein|uniref:hypothetical protein n=1 Tax=unclassified Rhodococcus (in: high G+C Gram-positive bacteria) TaxID=192944 RepID=UPI0002ABB115|nr:MULTISPECIES: hypothetical protein [unclassified Rhodococcus (in: high G+C Gram-positive bacteria)]CCQ18394.1 putative uncharacterized protein [Rhodococcus sp. AW25M09]
MSAVERKKRASLADQFEKPAPRGSGLANIFPRNGTGALTRPAPTGPASLDEAAGNSKDEPHVAPVDASVDTTAAAVVEPTPPPMPTPEPATRATAAITAEQSEPDLDAAAAAVVTDEDVRPIAVYVPAAVKEAWKARSQREKKSYGEIVEDAFAEHTPETLVRLFAPRPVESSRGGMPRLARPKVASGGVEVRPHLWVAQTGWIDEQVEASHLIPSRSALIAAVVESYLAS